MPVFIIDSLKKQDNETELLPMELPIEESEESAISTTKEPLVNRVIVIDMA